MVKNTIRTSISRIDELEKTFRTGPGDDAAEADRQKLLKEYVVVLHSNRMLNPSQQAQGYRESTALVVREAPTPASCRSR